LKPHVKFSLKNIYLCFNSFKQITKFMVKIILVGIILALVYSQPDLRLTVADWLRSASDFLVESVQVK